VTSRRPLRLDGETEQHVTRRPIPAVPPPGSGDPAVSVVVVVFDNLAVTRMTLESVLANTREPSYELIVVDNGSGAAAREYLSVLAARNQHVRVLRNARNRGFPSGVNAGLAVARGDVLVVLNNDTVVTPGWLGRLAGHLCDRAIGLVGPVTNRCGNEAEIPTAYDTYDDLLTFAAGRGRRSAPVDVPVATMFCAAMRRDVLSTVGLLDERFEVGLFEDDDYSRRVRDAGFRVVYAPDVFVHHFGEATIGDLAPGGEYGRVFAINRRRFEEKWGQPWSGHTRRPDPAYETVVRRVRRQIGRCTEPGAVVVVVSKGDDALVALPDRVGWHFPRLADGTYAGHHPADDDDAIGRLERLRAEGANYLAVPTTAAWWFAHYRGFTRHIDARYERVSPPRAAAVIYRLDEGCRG
jgi:GT2 family glycosyltransferase